MKVVASGKAFRNGAPAKLKAVTASARRNASTCPVMAFCQAEATGSSSDFAPAAGGAAGAISAAASGVMPRPASRLAAANPALQDLPCHIMDLHRGTAGHNDAFKWYPARHNSYEQTAHSVASCHRVVIT